MTRGSDDPAGLILGPLQLEARLGSGANGEVWRAVHRPSRIQVAVKIITAPRARLPDVGRALETEVRAVAALDHPNIVMLLDRGTIQDPGDSGFIPDSPYLVMELASGGTLERIKPLKRYQDLRAVLIALLDALAHAHARGVVHRDLTPRNILIAKQDDLRPGLKIADFGIAVPMEDPPQAAREDAVVGTLTYMAPEQLKSQWRDYGPWTDLFSLGLIAQRLATNKPPYPEGKPSEMFEARLLEERAPLDPIFPLPLGFRAWLDRMLAHDPSERFQRAADAAFALAEVGTPDTFDDLEGGVTTVRAAIDASPARTLSALQEPAGDPRRSAERPPPMPSSWRHLRSAKPLAHLFGAGLGLQNLRPAPFVDRDEARDQIWEALRRVRTGGRARMVAVTGPPGVGRSRLAEWITQRAHELGAATPLKASSLELARGDALGPMVERYFLTAGLDEDQARTQIRHRLSWQGVADEVMTRALTRLIRPGTDVDGEAAHRPPEAFETLRRFFALLGAVRPVAIWFDDVHRGTEALWFIKHVLDSSDPTPILFLVTTVEPSPAATPVETALLEALLKRSETDLIRLDPLDETAHRS